MAENNIGFGEAIRTIAKTKELETKINKALEELSQEKSSIAGQRAVWWTSAGGGGGAVSGVNTGQKPGEDALTQEQIDAAQEVIDEELNGQSFDPNLDASHPDEYSTDLSGAASLADAAVVSAADMLDAASQNDSSGNRITSQIIESTDSKGFGSRYYNTITGFSPDGDPMHFNLNGMYRLPEGWPDPNTPPTESTYRAGYYWVGGFGATSQKFKTFTEAAAFSRSTYLSANPTSTIGDVLGVDYPVGAPTTIDDSSVVPNPAPGAGNSFSYVFDDTADPYPGNFFLISGGQLNSCDFGTGTGAVCDGIPAPAETSWPDVGNGILAFIDGFWTPNQYDSEVPPIYQTKQSSIKFKMSDDRWGMMVPAKNGGKLLYEIEGGDNLNPKEGSFGILFRGNNTIEKFVDNKALQFYFVNL